MVTIKITWEWAVEALIIIIYPDLDFNDLVEWNCGVINHWLLISVIGFQTQTQDWFICVKFNCFNQSVLIGIFMQAVRKYSTIVLNWAIILNNANASPSQIVMVCGRVGHEFYLAEKVDLKTYYRVFVNEGHLESGSNLINFWPEILPKAF